MIRNAPGVRLHHSGIIHTSYLCFFNLIGCKLHRITAFWDGCFGILDGVFGIFVPLQESDDPSVLVHHSGVIFTNPSLPLSSSAFKFFINERLGIVYNNSQMKHLIAQVNSIK